MRSQEASRHKRKRTQAFCLTLFLLVIGGLVNPSYGQLGEADTATSGTVPNKSYDALCGAGKNEKRCKVEFIDGRLVVNGSEGITRKEALYLRARSECKQGYFLGMPNCYWYQYVTTSMLTYKRADGSEGVATFSFLNVKASENFHQDLELFMQGRPDQGIMTIEKK